MGTILAALIAILALLGVIILVMLAQFAMSALRCMPHRSTWWSGHVSIRFFNHPPETWAAP
jgi:hypothetical protein